MSLTQWWHQTWSDLRFPPPNQLLQDLLARYSEPHRAYHTAQHLEACADLFTRARALAQDPGAVQLALWFHDWLAHASISRISSTVSWTRRTGESPALP